MHRQVVSAAIAIVTLLPCATAATESVLINFQAPTKGSTPYAGVIRDLAGNLFGTTYYGGIVNPTCPAGCGVVYKIGPAGQRTVLYSFTGGADGSHPQTGLIFDSAGNLYGTTGYGGPSSGICGSGCGVVYKVDAAGHETVLYSFMGGNDGANPYSSLVRDTAGNLYGTATYGGTGYCYDVGCGVIYKVDPAGHETVLYNFTSDVGFPSSGVLRDSAGNLFGTATYGSFGFGAVYKVDSTGHETTLYSFSGAADGSNPQGNLIRDPAGNLYGTTQYGGVGHGLVYKLDARGHETVLYAFSGGADGSFPQSGVIRDSAGNLYGTTLSRGSGGYGVAFKLDASGRQTVLHSFESGADGALPYAGVILDAAGNLYGTTESGGTTNVGVVYKIDAMGSETVVSDFMTGLGGALPYSAVARDGAGNLYGTTYYGGAWNHGVVYKVDPAGRETVLYSFTGGADGGYPAAAVTLDAAGNLYGTTSLGGGTVGYYCPYGCGVVYQVDITGHETVLYNFTDGADGGYPVGGVTLDLAGNLYGVNQAGGTGSQGVVYKIDPTGREGTLVSSPGQGPSSGVVRDAAGNLYGTAQYGGAYGGGVVYKVDSGRETILHSFINNLTGDGRDPIGGVILDAAGNLYGTTNYGGAFGLGTVYRLDPAGNETILYSFMGGADGAYPQSGVTLDSAGNLYGTTSAGGSSAAGVVYKVDAQGLETVLYSFTGGSDGGYPAAGVIVDASGKLYGTTQSGGSRGGGVLFKIAP